MRNNEKYGGNNMRNMEYAYEILGINPMSIERNADGKRRTEEEKLIFLRERKEHRIHVLKNKMELSGLSDEAIQKYNEEILKIENIYNELINNMQITTIYQSNEKYDRFEAIYNKINGIPEDAYSVFGIARDICEKRDCEGNCIELDEAIKKRLEGLMELANKTKTLDFKEKQKNELRKKQIRDAYELIKNSSKRREYNKKLDMQKEKRKENLLRSKYQAKTYEKFRGQIRYKKCENMIRHKYYKQDNSSILLTQTGVIAYRDLQGINKLDEYEFERIIDGEKCIDKIYINLSIFDLSIDKNVRRPIVNPEYYNYIVNELLSEENILKAKKYNYNYMGKVIKDKDGNYQTVLDSKEATITKEHCKEKNKHENVEEIEGKGDR